MPLYIIRNDILNVECDAIVNATNTSLFGSGSVDGEIHRRAGCKLLKACKKLGGCPVGEARITKGYKLPSKYIIHTVGPVWQGGNNGEKALLESCYRNSLKLALENSCSSVAFPLISSGSYGYPKDKALRVATDMITEFLCYHDMTVYLVIYDKKAFAISEKLFADVESFIDDLYVEVHDYGMTQPLCSVALNEDIQSLRTPDNPAYSVRPNDKVKQIQIKPGAHSPQKTGRFESRADLNDMMSRIDESFSQMLIRKIDEKGISDADCYKKANVDRKLFSKIRKDINYHPKKSTAIAFAIALELDLKEARELISKAGYSLTRSSKFDIIIEYFLLNKNYNIFEINETLFAFDQVMLGV